MPPPQQNIDPAADVTAVSWTGGKDCNLTLLFAWRNPSLRVTSLVCFKPEGKQFLAHPIPLMEAQAVALGLPLLFIDIPEGTTDYMKAYVDGLVRLREEHDITVIATGDMDLVGTMKRNWIERCCEEVVGDKMRAYLPLWQMNRSQSLNIMLEEGFSIIFTCVKSPFFDKSWIGRRLDDQALEELELLASDEISENDALDGKKPLDVAGERGEYHTMCIDGPLYKHQIQFEIMDEPKQQDLVSKTRWKGNIHNTDCIWTILLKAQDQNGDKA